MKTCDLTFYILEYVFRTTILFYYIKNPKSWIFWFVSILNRDKNDFPVNFIIKIKVFSTFLRSQRWFLKKQGCHLPFLMPKLINLIFWKLKNKFTSVWMKFKLIFLLPVFRNFVRICGLATLLWRWCDAFSTYSSPFRT